MLLIPATLFFVIFFVGPVILLTINSFYGYSRMTGMGDVLTLDNYRRLLLDPYYLSIIWLTLRVAFVSALVTVIVGYPVALYLTISSRRVRAWIIFFVLAPLMISVIIRTFGWVIIIGPNGLLDHLFASLGLGQGSFLHTDAAVIVGLVNVLLPFVVLAVATSLQSIDPAIPLAASSLGASPVSNFIRVMLPLSMPGVVAGFLIVFSLAASSFITPAVLGGARYKVLSTVMYQQAMILQNWPFAGAIAVVLIVTIFMLTTLQSKILERDRFGAVSR
jgi:putative spermidine/putrescine transport system permease protein